MHAGKRPERSLAAYGAYLRSLPFSNEQGLRMLIGAALREAAARGVVLRPLFSYYSFHGCAWAVCVGSGCVACVVRQEPFLRTRSSSAATGT